MQAHRAQGIDLVAAVAAWLAARVGLFVPSRHLRRSLGSARGAERLVALECRAGRPRPHLDAEDEDPHVQWLGAGGAV